MSIKNTLATRIRQCRQSQSLTLQQLAQQSGLSASRISNWEQGTRTPSIEAVVTLAHIFDQTPAWLLGINNSQDEFSSDYSLVPRYSVQGSAGRGCSVSSEQIVDHLAFRTDWLTGQMGLQTDQLALITVKGDSMEPTLYDGDLVLIDQRADTPREAAIYALAIDNDVWIKRLQKHIDGRVSMISDNKAQYPVEQLSLDTVERLRILGRVVWSGHRLA